MRLLLPLLLLLAACDTLPGEDEPATPRPDRFGIPLDAGALSGLHRLTQTEYRNSVQDLLGVAYDGDLPPDFVLHGYTSVGAAEVTVAPLDFEQYEAAAWDVATAAVPDEPAAVALLGCSTVPPLGREELADSPEPCVRAFLVDFLGQAWRRPVAGDDVQRFYEIYDSVLAATDRPLLATQALVAGALTSPDFLFRVELGLPSDNPELRLLDPHEQAARIALAFFDRPPDPALLALADTEGLATPEAISATVAALLADPADTAALERFFFEWLELDQLDLVTKDPARYPEWNDALKAAMVDEMILLWRSIALDQDTDLRSLLTTTESYVTPDLAALYEVADPGDATLPISLPADRAGILTRGAFLATNAHPALTSPTHRGRYVRARLLCKDIPPPPEGVVASLDGSDITGTLRDLLQTHADDPACSGCHDDMDPIGFAFEGFGPIGETRAYDNGFPIDDSASLDDVAVQGGAELGAAVADHHRLPPCIAANAWSHVLGHIEQRTESDQLDGTAEVLAADGFRLSSLLTAIAETVAFRTVATPEGGACERDEEGDSRPCATECGAGEEVCTGGTWRGCTAQRPIQESCNGVDDDCDGSIDEVVFSACSVDGAPGIDTCEAGAWTGCEAIPALETCNGVDDDGDGEVDEQPIDFRVVTAADITASHEACDPATNTNTPACRAAVHRMCANTACSVSGLGPIARGDGEYAVVCLREGDVSVQTASYTAFEALHPYCNQTQRFGMDCNASINRWCSNSGLGTGYGPLENSGDVAVVGCNPTAAVYEGTYTELATYASVCNGSSQRWGEDCDAAFHRFCRARGHTTGHGPLENTGDLAWVACIGDGS